MPLSDNLANNGGPTMTCALINTSTQKSIAIDAGDDSVLTAVPPLPPTSVAPASRASRATTWTLAPSSSSSRRIRR